MTGTRQIAGGLVIALVSMVMIGASLVSALAENRLLLPISTATAPANSTEPTAGETPTQSVPVETPVPSATFPPPPTECMPPAGWLPYFVAQGETLAEIAEQIGSTPQAIAEANCLANVSLIPDTVVYLPSLPVTPTATGTATPAPSSTPALPTPTMVSCGRPAGWIAYIVQPGDTLYSLAQAYYTSVYQLQAANCLGSSTYIRAGQRLWVPNVATRTPTPTASFTPSNTPTPSSTPSASSTPTPSASPAASPTPTWTGSPTPSPTATNPDPTATATATPPPPTSTATSPPPTTTPTGTATPQ